MIVFIIAKDCEEQNKYTSWGGFGFEQEKSSPYNKYCVLDNDCVIITTYAQSEKLKKPTKKDVSAFFGYLKKILKKIQEGIPSLTSQKVYILAHLGGEFDRISAELNINKQKESSFDAWECLVVSRTNDKNCKLFESINDKSDVPQNLTEVVNEFLDMRKTYKEQIERARTEAHPTTIALGIVCQILLERCSKAQNENYAFQQDDDEICALAKGLCSSIDDEQYKDDEKEKLHACCTAISSREQLNRNILTEFVTIISKKVKDSIKDDSAERIIDDEQA